MRTTEISMLNEEVFDITSGCHSFSEKVYYRYLSIAQNHKYKFLFDPNRVLLQKDFISRYNNGENPFPESVEIDPSNACNHDCPFCIYSSLHKRGRREILDQERLQKLICEIGELGCKSVLFIGGGEPLINRGTVPAIVQARVAGMNVGLVTNGSLVDEKKSTILKQYATYIRISLDAATAQTHQIMHGGNDFERIIKNIEKLSTIKGDATIGISFFINQYNYKEIFDCALKVKELGADYIQFKTYSGISFEELLQENILNELDNTLSLSDHSFDVHIMERIFKNSSFQVRGYSKCHWQAFKTIIGANGDVYLCTQKRDKTDATIGNIYSQSLSEIWSGKKRKEVVDNIRLLDCPYCVHHQQNTLIEFLNNFNSPHKNFF